jgi:translation initiation factor 3 subunit E
MIDFLEEQKLASHEEIIQARIKAVSCTNMVDYLLELYQEAKISAPEDIESKKAAVISEFQSKQSQLKPLLEAIESNGVESIKGMSLADFCIKYNLPTDVLDVLFEYSRLSYQVGDYQTSSELLKIYRILTSSTETSTVPTDRQLRAMWGSIASYIVQGEYKAASDLISKLIEFFDTTTLPKDKYSSGASGLWLLHWAILSLLQSTEPLIKEELLSLVLREKFINVVSVAAPHLWRYMSALVLMSPVERLETIPTTEMAIMLQNNPEALADPINAVIVDIFLHYDFESAEKHLQGISVDDDYYLAHHAKSLKSSTLVNHIKQRLYIE